MAATRNDEAVGTLSFEAALAELETIVRGLEGGQLNLEDAISAYERGAALRRHCEGKLGEAEMRVRAIVAREDGTTTVVHDQGLDVPADDQSGGSVERPARRATRSQPDPRAQ